jgi:anti-sigma B factor antagonist
VRRDTVPLSLNTRGVGKVTIVRCTGRIASGEIDVLHAHIVDLLRDRSDIVLHLGEVAFVDSSGLGMLVRLLTSTRSARGDLKLCQVPEVVHKVLKITSLTTLFDIQIPKKMPCSLFTGDKPRRRAPRRPALPCCA